MNKKSLIPALVAGLAGGMISHYLTPQPVYAQTAMPRELRAGSFVLVNEDGTVLAKLCDEAGRPSLKLFDHSGREIWSAGGKIGIRPAGAGK